MDAEAGLSLSFYLKKLFNGQKPHYATIQS